MSASGPAACTQTPNRVLPKNSVALSHLLVLGGYFVATLLFTWPLAANLSAAIPGDSFDGWQNYWNQWWIKQALIDRLVWPLHTDILYAPTGVNLYFHTLNPFNGLATLPVQRLNTASGVGRSAISSVVAPTLIGKVSELPRP